MKKLLTMLLLMATVMPAMAQDDPYKAKMTAWDEESKVLYEQYKAIFVKEKEQKTDAGQAEMKQLMEKLDSIEQLQIDLVMQIVRDNKSNQLPAAYISDAMYSLSYEQLTEALDSTTAYYNNPSLDKAKRRLAGLQKRAPGTRFKDLSMKDTDDRFAQLSQWVGKGNYVLIDFWASWCPPCRAEMPNLVKNYAKYHAKGFEIVGVSLDKTKDAWVTGIEQLGLTWPQISDLAYWKSTAVDVYGISSIPSSVLVGPDGVIVAIDLRGDALGEKLKAIYGF